ncbi:MAG: hypothetical protein KJ737_16555 [Proteobacteria bacterium]|nr:hypothetical protein [Pseudomonadota bacterium]
MTFLDDLKKGIDDLFLLAGKDAVFTPKNGFPENIRVIFRQGATSHDGALCMEGKIRVRKSDIPDPELPGNIEIDEILWTSTGIIEGDGETLWELSVKRDIKPTFKR